jgi:hypothetical protein
MANKERPLCYQVSAFGCESAELLLAYLINLLPESFGTPFFGLNLTTKFLEGLLEFGVLFSPPCHWLSVPDPLEGLPLPGTT